MTQEAHYRLELKAISRTQKPGKPPPRSIMAAAAYNARTTLADHRQGMKWSYTRKTDAFFSQVIAPPAPPWALDRQALWTRVDACEKRRDANTAKELLLSAPRELTHDQQIAAALDFVARELTSRGLVADVNGHKPKALDGDENAHFHVLIPTRAFDPTTGDFATRKLPWLSNPADADAEMTALRAAWADCVNRQLELARKNVRVSHLSRAARAAAAHAVMTDEAKPLDVRVDAARAVVVLDGPPEPKLGHRRVAQARKEVRKIRRREGRAVGVVEHLSRTDPVARRIFDQRAARTDARAEAAATLQWSAADEARARAREAKNAKAEADALARSARAVERAARRADATKDRAERDARQAEARRSASIQRAQEREAARRAKADAKRQDAAARRAKAVAETAWRAQEAARIAEDRRRLDKAGARLDKAIDAKAATARARLEPLGRTWAEIVAFNQARVAAKAATLASPPPVVKPARPTKIAAPAVAKAPPADLLPGDTKATLIVASDRREATAVQEIEAGWMRPRPTALFIPPPLLAAAPPAKLKSQLERHKIFGPALAAARHLVRLSVDAAAPLIATIWPSATERRPTEGHKDFAAQLAADNAAREREQRHSLSVALARWPRLVDQLDPDERAAWRDDLAAIAAELATMERLALAAIEKGETAAAWSSIEGILDRVDGVAHDVGIDPRALDEEPTDDGSGYRPT